MLLATDVDKAVDVYLNSVAIDDFVTFAIVANQTEKWHLLAVAHHFEVDEAVGFGGLHRTKLHVDLCEHRPAK